MTQDQWREVIETTWAERSTTARGDAADDDDAARQHCESVQHGRRVCRAGQVNYAASKGGINGLTRSLAKELAPRNVGSTPSLRA